MPGESESERYLEEGRVGEVLFSGSTYQVEVVDEKSGESMWPFFQFDAKGNLKDAFCSCESEEGECIHLAAAKGKIYSGHDRPLHLRFQDSLWLCLAHLFGDDIGYEPELLTKKKAGLYEYHNGVSFRIWAKSREKIEKLGGMIEDRPKETPETSIKFSNLSQEEIGHWKAGRPSADLRFELSFWADLAKWWMALQDGGEKCTFSYQESEEGWPTTLEAKWKDLELSFTLDLADLERAIPTLSTVDFPLKVYKGGAEQVEAITYDPKKRVFHIHRKAQAQTHGPREERPIGEWFYVPGEGFYPRDGESPLANSTIEENKINELLTLHGQEVQKVLQGVEIHEKPVSISYDMHFDSNWNWHFEAYLFEKKDLQKNDSALFGNWAYIEAKGFYPVEGLLFEAVEDTVEAAQVSQFISTHRIWLNTQIGFNTHLASVETHLAYTLTAKGKLQFFSKLYAPDEAVDTHDFGEWIYFAKEGFFSKKHSRLSAAVRPGVEIPHAEIDRFIKKHREELESIPRFFFQPCPFKSRGLKVEPKSDTSLRIVPEHSPADLKIRLFGDFVYVGGKGFCELPAKMRLPEKYQNEVVIHQSGLARFFEEEFEEIKGLITTLDPRLKRPDQFELELHYLVRTTEGGLKAKLYYRTEFGLVPVTELAAAIEKKERYLFSSGGLLRLHVEAFQWLHQHKRSMQPDVQTIELSTMDFLRLEMAQEIKLPDETTPALDITRTLLKELREFLVTESPDTKGLKSELRPYQQIGLHWLWFLYRNGLAGLLCDDMGLGKTHQTMALMAAVFNQKPARFLVVCPTSVIYHWQDKLAEYFPTLKVHTFHGLKRTLKRLPKDGVILTSYGILRMEKEALKKIFFDIAVFDEIQIAKNPKSRVHHALRMMDAKMKLGLTGTPIENRLSELKALFDIVLPHYMPSEARFRELFVNPIEKDGDASKRALLSRIIRPFILRRRKQEVLQELPEKSENKAYCDLSVEQAILYRKTIEQNREEIISGLRDRDAPIPYVHIFSILTNLKQVCNHPALIAKDPKNYKNYQSGKWDLFEELIDEARESDQKVVVFSQYLYMLDIFENHFKERGWKYAQIRGDTIDRREQLRRFQEDPDCLFFIGSLLAAGLGIDLTAASVVILYDRWWNAARENQAIDRVHRIGQKWGVQVFKLITKNTIEEKIDLIITRKGRLMEEVVESDDQGSMKKFTRSELIDLLSYQES